MKIKEVQSVEIQLTLTEFEARWLMEVMRNPLHGETYDNEDKESRFMRGALFNGIRTTLKD